jgi:hypothetical protein
MTEHFSEHLRFKTLGFDGKSMEKVKVDALRGEVKLLGFFEISDTGGPARLGRKHFHRAKTDPARHCHRRSRVDHGGAQRRCGRFANATFCRNEA